jgi:hypothetical protein
MITMRAQRAALVAALVLVVLAPLPAAEVIDRVLAVVGGAVITQSDVAAALEFGIVNRPPAGGDPVRVVLDELIRRELIMSEVTRFPVADTLSAAVDTRMAAIRAGYASEAGYQAALARTAMNLVRLRDAVSASLRIDEYLQQRFGAVAEPSDEEVAQYYAENRAAFTSGGRLLTFDEAKDLARQRLARARRNTLIGDWVLRLRRRATVTDLYVADTGKQAAGLKTRPCPSLRRV